MSTELWTWRTGRKVGRTVYRQVGFEPSDDDQLIGVMDTPELAALVVEAVNKLTVASQTTWCRACDEGTPHQVVCPFSRATVQNQSDYA